MEGIRMYKEKTESGVWHELYAVERIKREQQDLSGDGEYLP